MVICSRKIVLNKKYVCLINVFHWCCRNVQIGKTNVEVDGKLHHINLALNLN